MPTPIKAASAAAIPPTLPATVQTAVAPAPAPKPATAAVPAKTGAKNTPKATVRALPEEMEMEEPPPVAEENPMLPYLEAVRGISALRAAGTIGPSVGSSRREVGFSRSFTAYPTMTVESESSRYDPSMSREEAAMRRQGKVAPPIMPPKDIENVTFGQMASAARSVDLAYQGAVEAAGDADSALRRAATDPSKTPNDLKALEDEKVRALRRVADLAATRREFGMETTTIAQGQAPLLAPAPTVGPRTGGGKEYY